MLKNWISFIKKWIIWSEKGFICTNKTEVKNVTEGDYEWNCKTRKLCLYVYDMK